MEQKIYIEIGYTNFKIKKNNEITIVNNHQHFKQLKLIIKFYTSRKYKIYILNNNLNVSKKIDKWKRKFNFFLFDKYLYANTFNIPNYFQINQIGEDLIFLLNYLMNLTEKNIILMSAGTALVSIVKRNNKINSISINLGIENQVDAINKKLNWTIKNEFTNRYNLNSTNNAVNLGIFNCINGIIKQIQSQNPQTFYNFIFCGNGFDLKWSNFLLKTYKPLVLDNNFVLNLFSEWVNNNLKT